MLVQEMLDAALAVVTEHNSVVGQGNPGFIDPTTLINNIKAAGGTSVDRLKALSYEDILSCMPLIGTIKPIGVAKDVAKIFRGKETVTNEPRPVSAKKADKMTLIELIEAYDPEDSDNPVGKRLGELAKGQKVIVFITGRIVDVNTTFKLLQEVKLGYPGRANIDVNGEIKETHLVGALPDNFVDENPLYRGRPLRPDGTCDQTNRSWNGVPDNVRKLIRVAIDCGSLKDISFERVHDIMDLAMDVDAFAKFSKRYPNAAIAYKNLTCGIGSLPTLKLILKREKGAGGTNRPFDNAKKVEWVVKTPAAQVAELIDDTYKAFYRQKK